MYVCLCVCMCLHYPHTFAWLGAHALPDCSLPTLTLTCRASLFFGLPVSINPPPSPQTAHCAQTFTLYISHAARPLWNQQKPIPFVIFAWVSGSLHQFGFQYFGQHRCRFICCCNVVLLLCELCAEWSVGGFDYARLLATVVAHYSYYYCCSVVSRACRVAFAPIVVATIHSTQIYFIGVYVFVCWLYSGVSTTLIIFINTITSYICQQQQ